MKKFFGFLFILSLTSSIASNFVFYKQDDFIYEEEFNNSNKFINDMNEIYSSSETDFEDEIIKYDSENKVYNLKQDIDFTNFEGDIYGEGNVQLVQDSTFNGNGYEIQNRYNSESLVNNFNYMLTSDYRKTNDSYILNTTSLYNLALFPQTNGSNIYNLNLNNSPFVFGTIEDYSVVENVNLYNVSIENLIFDSQQSDISADDTDFNTFNFALFSFSEGAGVSISNSSFNNINISNNTFNLTQESSDNSGNNSKSNQNVSVSFSLFGAAVAAEGETSSTQISNIEINNFNIENNQIFVDTYNNNQSNSSKTGFIFSPLNSILGYGLENNYSASFFEEDFWLTNDEVSYKNNTKEKDIKDGIENNLIYQNIFIHNITFLNNFVNYNLDSSLNEISQYFNILPILEADDFYLISQKNIVLDGINVGESDVTLFSDTSKNTTLSISNNVIWLNENNSDLFVEQLINSNQYNLEDNWSKNKQEKDLFFDSNYWNTNDNEDLQLYKSNINYLPNLYLSNSYEEESFGDLILNIDLNYHNYYLGLEDNSYISIVDQNDNELFTYKILNSNETIIINLNDLNLDLNDNTYTLKINVSEFNTKYNLEIDINDYLYNSWLIFNFQNYIYDSSLVVDFNLNDPFLEIDSINVDLYTKNKKIDSKSYLYLNEKNNTKSSESVVLSFDDVSKINASNSYLVVNFVINGKTYDYDSQKNNFILGSTNYLEIKNIPNKWSYYYWWVILLIVISIIAILIFILLFYIWKNKQHKIEDIETRIKLIDEKYGYQSDSFNDYNQDQNNFNSQIKIDNEQLLDEDYYQYNDYDQNEEQYYNQDEQYYDQDEQYYDQDEQYYDQDEQYYDQDEQYYDQDEQHYDQDEQYYDQNEEQYYVENKEKYEEEYYD